MFTEKTVIILGAGASWHYGYPTGEALIKNLSRAAEKIYKAYFDTTFNVSAFPYLEFVVNKLPKNSYPHEARKIFCEILKEFYTRLEAFDPIMIDSFLNDNPSLRDIGKTLIAYEILESECLYIKKHENRNRHAELEQKRKNIPSEYRLSYEECGFKDNWYRYLVDAIISGCIESQDILKDNLANLKIITFNYDVSLENYLYTRLSDIERFKEGAHIETLLNEELVTHVYGKVRNNAFEDKDYGKAFLEAERIDKINSSESYKYRLELAYEASKGLEVIDKEKFKTQYDKTPLVLARENIQKAKNVFILGFGFYEDNIKLLDLDEKLTPENINQMDRMFYTNYGDTKKIERKVLSLVKAPNGKPRVGVTKSEKNVYDALAYDFDFI